MTEEQYNNYVTRGGSRAAGTSKMECFVIIVNGFQLFTTVLSQKFWNVH